MTLPALSAALGASSTTSLPAPADVSLPETAGVPGEGAAGGFAAALDEAAASLDALGAEVPATTHPAPPPLALLATLPTGLATIDAGAAPSSPSDAGLDGTAPVPGWPPPGLSSLFPGGPVLAAEAGAQAAASTLASARGFALGALLPDGSGGSTSEAASLSPATLLSSATGAATPPTPAASSMPATSASGPDALAAVLARQPAPLRLPVAEDGDPAALAALTETLGLERAPEFAPTLASTPSPALQKLDLAQAFPAPVPLPSPRFADDVGARLQWIAEQKGGEATLRISPDGLGPVEIRLKLDGDRVDLGFTATQQETRQALQDALPKLREMLAQQGLQMGQADVGHKHAQSSQDEAARGSSGRAQDGEDDGIVRSMPSREANVIIARSGRGVLDLYA